MGTRPVLYYVQGGADATGCDGASDCVKRIFLIGTPAMWWIALPVLFWALWRIIGRQDWRYAAVWSPTAPATCRGSSTSTGRCTSST